MADNELVNELDRNMDTTFDNLNIINAAITAFAQTLQPAPAQQVAARLDETLDSYAKEVRPPSRFHQDILRGWRNMAAQRAGLPRRLS